MSQTMYPRPSLAMLPKRAPFDDPGDTTIVAEGTVGAGFLIQPRDFRTVKPLGMGAFSNVKLALHVPTGQYFALKVVQLTTPENNESVMKELETLKAVSSPYVAQYYGYFVTAEGLHIVLEHMDLGSLKAVFPPGKSATEPVLYVVAKQMTLGLAEFQSRRVVHRDIKPSNVLVNSRGQVKFADFNTSRVLRDTMDNAYTFTGSAAYMAPERLDSRGSRHQSDVWSMGLTLLEIATGKNPYAAEAHEEAFFALLSEIQETPSPSLPHSRFSAAAIDFVRLCLEKDPDRRPAADVLLRHPFLQQTQFDGALVERLKR